MPAKSNVKTNHENATTHKIYTHCIMKKHSTIKIILTSVLTLIIISSTTLAKLPKKEFQAEIMQQRI